MATKQAEPAQVLSLNKIDPAGGEEMNAIMDRVGEENPGVDVLQMQAPKGTDIEDFLERVGRMLV